MSKLELIFTGNNGNKMISVLRDSEGQDTVLDIAKNAQEAFDNYAELMANLDMGDGDIWTLMSVPDECEREDWELIDF